MGDGTEPRRTGAASAGAILRGEGLMLKVRKREKGISQISQISHGTFPMGLRGW